MFGFRRTSLFATLCIFLVSSYILYSLIDSTAENADAAASEDQVTPFTFEHNLSMFSVGGRNRFDTVQWCAGTINCAQLFFDDVSSRLNKIQMLDLYEKLHFDNPDGGKWKQGWDVQYDPAKSGINGPKLKVFVVPHSHTDPGWVKTFDEYYASSVEGIFDSMLEFLSRTPKAKFIYAEMSFFERWWKDMGFKERENLLKLLQNGQLEIVTGAWVQTDEANSHYFSMIDQLIEGHQWLYNHVGFVPKNHWSIDPFGLSPTMAHFVHLAGIKNLAIQRVHYSIKKYLASTKGLEFFWRQLWNSTYLSIDAFTHLFPFYSYDIPHTCGPDPSICCQFDFARYKGSSFSCPWGFPAQLIDESNILERASLLLDQYRKHAQLYRGNVLLVPLGDDFRYVKDKEWRLQYDNYAKLFEFMNAQKEWNVQVQFGTLEDYFSALELETRERKIDFPTLSGDFFSYADRDNDYWVGYFTSRPFYKRMERTLAHHVRWANQWFDISYPASELFQDLVSARRNLALFQHHDGITGTAKTYVMQDYGVIATSLRSTGRKGCDQCRIGTAVGSCVLHPGSCKSRCIFRTLVFYNSLPYGRSDVVCIHTDKSGVKLFDAQSRPVEVQISPYVKRSSNGTSGQSISIRNTVDLTESNEDYEIVMRLLSNIDNAKQEFFSDLNGFQMVKRKYFGKLPLQGNFYPMPSAAFIEDHRLRLTLLSGQPGAVASLTSG
ncbi:Glycosyl hydrolases family 38 protein [Trichuris trichiura]|uniref:Glycosyl hydrolases family 38 protein n=1 Tax=Trichuris trichiura TaxID=36087 RepID=A0A077Z4M9_TRITR|nr:Glycosyl hydrolases family 38 protein [Trichuris trichiura]